MARAPLYLIIILGALSAFGPMSIDLYLPSLPALERDLAAAAGSAQFTLAAFVIGLALGQALYGPLVDHFGRKRPLYFGIAIYILASVGCALAPNMESLVALRLLQALGSCAGAVVSRAMVRDLFDAQTAAKVYSMLALVTGLAPILSPLLGGYLLSWFGWESSFWVMALFGAACLAATLTLPESGKPAPRGTPLALATALRNYGVLLSDRRFLAYALTGGFAFGGVFAYVSSSPFVFIELHGVAPEHFGWLFGINSVGLIAGTQINRRLLQTWAASQVLAGALAAAALLGVALLLAAVFDLGLLGLQLPLFGFMTCMGFVMPNAMACGMAGHGKLAGSASALMGTLQFTGATTAGVLVGLLHAESALPMAGVIAGCALAALLSNRVLARP